MDFTLPTESANHEMDGQFLYRSLGSFWTTLFREKDTLKGYTLGLAEEVIQRYFDFVEVINSFSPKEINIFHREKWKPLLIYKSKFNQEPFVFEDGDATFGAQSATAAFYADQVFQFGEPKRPTSRVFVYSVGKDLASFGTITDRIISPTRLFVSGTDVILQDGALFFNSNIFDDLNIPQLELIGENGQPITFVNAAGVTEEDKLIILWVFNAETDTDALYDSFGRIFKLQQKSSIFYKRLLESIFNLYIDGPTIKAIKTCCAAFFQTPTILNATEVVEEIFTDSDDFIVVVTDKEVYKLDSADYTLADYVVVGRELQVGDLLSNNIQLYDNTHQEAQTFYGNGNFSSGWWNKQGVLSSKVTLSKYLFSGPYLHQLAFSTEFDIVTLNADGDIVFPVEGVAQDVKLFHDFLNSADNKEPLKEIFGLTTPGDVYTTVPLTFIMENFLKQNTMMLKFSFITKTHFASFLNLMPMIRQYTPPYAYLILKVDINVPVDELDTLNNSTVITFNNGSPYDLVLNSDGSDEDGFIQKLEPYNYINVKQRLFEVSRGIKKDVNNALDQDYVVASDAAESPEDLEIANPGRVVTVRDGGVLREIPEGATTAQYNNLLLLDFSA